MFIKKFKFSYFYKIWYLALYRNIARYNRTYLGSFWIGFTNLLQVVVLGLVYGTVFKVPSAKDYFIYLGFGISIWTFMGGCITSFSDLLIREKNRILNYPKSIYDILAEEYIFQVQVFFQALITLIFVLLFLDPSIIFNIFNSIGPLIVLLIGVFWMSILTSIASLWIRDIGQLIPVIVQLLFLVSPIMYQKEALRSLRFVIKLNPLFQYLEPLRESFISGNVDFWGTIIDLIISLTLLMISIQLVVNLKYKIVDLVAE
tara:strand:- start:2484 stop:3260 length:777 start_codon:yes stop_codon:yes gene_type:complete